MRRYLDEQPYLKSGRQPPGKQTLLSDLLKCLCRRQGSSVQNGNITRTTYKEYEAVCDAIAGAIGKHRPVETLGPDDFVTLRMAIAVNEQGKEYSPHTMKRRLTVARICSPTATKRWGYRSVSSGVYSRHPSELSVARNGTVKSSNTRRRKFKRS